MATLEEDIEALKEGLKKDLDPKKWPPVKQWGIGEWGSAASILGVGLWGFDQFLKIVFNFSVARAAKQEVQQLKSNRRRRQKS